MCIMHNINYGELQNANINLLKKLPLILSINAFHSAPTLLAYYWSDLKTQKIMSPYHTRNCHYLASTHEFINKA